MIYDIDMRIYLKNFEDVLPLRITGLLFRLLYMDNIESNRTPFELGTGGVENGAIGSWVAPSIEAYLCIEYECLTAASCSIQH